MNSKLNKIAMKFLINIYKAKYIQLRLRPKLL